MEPFAHSRHRPRGGAVMDSRYPFEREERSDVTGTAPSAAESGRKRGVLSELSTSVGPWHRILSS
jgi:hypothetical protein